MKWSFSGLKTFSNCPKQFYETKVAKNFEQEETDATRYGKDVHRALEFNVNFSLPLPANYARFQSAIDALKAIPGQKYCELEMGIKADRVTPCDFDDPDYWVHGIADLCIVNGTVGYVVDYKTGKAEYADTSQLRLMALMMFARFPDLQEIRGGLLFLLQNLFITENDRSTKEPLSYLRRDSNKLWQSFNGTLQRLELAAQTNVWPANPSGLCKKHCPVVTCQFNGKR